MKLGLMVGVAVAFSAFAPHAAAQYYSRQEGSQVVRCESTDGRTRQCNADTRGGVQMLRQLSKTQCVEGRNWGYGRDGIWVTQGCRAEFAAYAGGWNDNGYGNRYGNGYGNDGYGNGGAQIVRCESNDGRYRTCGVPSGGRVILSRQLSRTACIEGRTWGSTGNGIWVNQGCRADFQVLPGRNWGNGRGNDNGRYGRSQTIHCASEKNHEKLCGARIYRGVRLERQYSKSQCTEGYSWGWDRRGVWVSHGCRADFTIY